MRTTASGAGIRFPSALDTGPAAAGYTSLTSYASTIIPATGPYPPMVQVQGDGSLLVQACEFTGTVSLHASNITFRGCRFTIATPFYSVQPVGGPTNVSYIDCEAFPQAGSATDYGFVAGGVGLTVLRCNLWGFTLQPVQCSFGNVLIQDSYFHDYQPGPSTNHAEPVYLGSVGTAGSMDNVVVRHNTMLAAQYNPYIPGVNNNTACMFMRGPTGSETFSFSNFLVEQNLFAGGSYAVYCGGLATSSSGIVFQDNRFSTLYGSKCGINGTHTNAQPWGTNGNVWQRNTWLDGANAGQVITG